jgi:YgiT-type zinc finger domain-containing protein
MGRLDLRLTTYTHMYDGTLVNVPNTPAWVCDVCHTWQFEPEAVRRIELLIGQAGPPPNRYQPLGAKRVAHRRDPKTAATTNAKPRPKINKG